jgi:para-nitrobenzyl esterase
MALAYAGLMLLLAVVPAEAIAQTVLGSLEGTAWRAVELKGATGKPLAVFEPRQAAASADARLQGTAWRLVTFQGGDDRTLTPDDRSKYTIEFLASGQLAARVDCNRGRGTWKATAAGQLELGPLALTRAKCADGSLHDQIARQCTFIRSFVIKDGHLFLALMADGGIYEFEPVTP